MTLYATSIPPKPPRPFTEYHIFFQLERNHILQISNGKSPDNNIIDPTHLDGILNGSDVDTHAADRPPRYRSLVLPAGWHTKGSRPKCRSHRKNHGKITFLEMTKLISRRWKEADKVTRAYCRDLAERELKRYREEMREYVERYGERALRLSKRAGGGGKKNNKKGGKGKKKRRVSEEDGKLTQDADEDVADLAVLKDTDANKEKMNLQQAQPAHTAAPVPQDLAALYPIPFETQEVLQAHSGKACASACNMPAPQDDVMATMMYPNQFGSPQQASHPVGPSLFPNHFAQATFGHTQAQGQVQAFAQLQQQQQMEAKLLQLRHELQNRKMEMELMNNMQHQAQSQAGKYHTFMGQATMMPQEMPQVMRQQEFDNSGHYKRSRNSMMVLTTVKDQGQLPPLLEDQEYHDLPLGDLYDYDTSHPARNSDRGSYYPDMGYNDTYSPKGKQQLQPQAQESPQDKPQFDDVFDSTFDSEPVVPQFNDDCSIIGPMGIMPKSPSGTPPPPLPPIASPKFNKSNEASSSSTVVRAKSISPMPEYNIAPEISFLAKNFVNEFSRYLNHDHEVQKTELEALDHQGMEKQALKDMFMAGSQGTKRSSDATSLDSPMMGAGTEEFFEPLKNNGGKGAASCNVTKGFNSYPSKTKDNATFLPGGTSPDFSKAKHSNMCLPAAGNVHDFSKPPSKHTIAQQQQPFTNTSPDVHKTNTNQFTFDDLYSTGSTLSRSNSRDEFQAWLNDDVLI